ncbi:SDR family NAD(P)-dependent oxidoreductase [Arthrobacter sp. 35W]|uniref:SDR family NAD(P)-dependent oxidoreductase n=1 Tax=Arthrobacter sp. 35W TaxID=1132441 RepID=UPI00041E46D5|nr:SDR family oxidoreductase [Arthrobacter sp. 35W]
MSTPNGTALTMSGLGCLVVGAASGIGQATAQLLSTKVGRVVGADLPSATWPNAAAQYPQLPIDISDPGSVHEAVEKAISLVGRLDVVINTAGILGKIQPSSEETLEEFERLVRINLVGAFSLSQAVLPVMAANGFGRLVHFSSTAGKEGVAGMTGYSASKAGITGLVKALAKEYATSGVTVNAIAPGKIDTPLVSALPPTEADLQRIPMHRLGTAEEAAALVEYIISPAASYTTGFIYDLSGGRATY